MNNSNQFYVMLNGISVAVAMFLLCLSLWLAPVDLSTKGYWGMGVLWLCGSLVNMVKYRADDRMANEMSTRVQRAKTEKLVSEFATKP